MSFKRVIPLFDRVLVEKLVAPAKTAGGILLPENAAKALNTGVVRAVGAGAPTRDGNGVVAMPVKEGDKVLLPEFGGSKLALEEGKEHYLFRAEDILAVLHEK
jgi:chaperonin GroES